MRAYIVLVFFVLVIFGIFLVFRGNVYSPSPSPQSPSPPSFILPYVSKDEIVSVPQLWNPPNHTGIDFKGKMNTSYVAVCSGTVVNIQKVDLLHNYVGIDVFVKINSVYSYYYCFEPFAGGDDVYNEQLNRIVVKVGDEIQAGQLIGRLYAVGDFPHIHLGVTKNGQDVDPLPYFTPEAQKEILELKEPTIMGSYDPTPIDNIENHLYLIYTDPPNDCYNRIGNCSAIDFTEIYMGVYNGRLYIKWVLNGIIPERPLKIGNNTIVSVSYNMIFDTDNNTCDGWNGAENHLQFNVYYHETEGQIWYNTWGRLKCINPWVPEGQFEKEPVNGICHTGNGGLGKSQFIVSYNLADFYSDMQLGKYMNLQFWSEAGYDHYEHYALDSAPNLTIGGSGSNWGEPPIIHWKIQEIQGVQ